jgi:WD repeat-containing protein 7
LTKHNLIGDVQVMNSHHFTIPIGFVPGEGLVDGKYPFKSVPNAITAACIKSKPSCLASWGFAPQDDSDSEDAETIKGHPAYGVVMGSQDGSLYIFHGAPSSRFDLIGRVKFNVHLVDSHQQSKPSISSNNLRLSLPSRSSSPSSLRSAVSPLPVSRSRIVSGLSMEQVEAPKNYVDFDDEPEKLKEMLKGRSVSREKAMIDGMRQAFDKDTIIDKVGSPPPTPGSSSRRKDDDRSLLLASTSASIKSGTPSIMSSPMLSPTNNRSEMYHPYSLSLRYHVFLPKCGPMRGITHISLVKRDQYAVCLQEHGYIFFAFWHDVVRALLKNYSDISVFTISDGSCIATSSHRGRPVFPPADLSLLHTAWSWNSLHIGEIGEVGLIQEFSHVLKYLTSRLGGNNNGLCHF